jgi:predicted RNA-binding protein with PUA-like domain
MLSRLVLLLFFTHHTRSSTAADAHHMFMVATSRHILSLQRSINYNSRGGAAFVQSTMPKRSLGVSKAVVPTTDTSRDEASTQYFLLKSEPADYSISDLERDGTEEWNGIRNYQARNFLRSMKVGDRAFFYHSKAAKQSLTGIVGSCRIVREAQPDASALDPKSEYYDAKCTEENCKWDSVLVEYEQTFPVVLTLKEIKDVAAKVPDGLISSLALLKQSRLSVVPLEKAQWDEVIRLIDEKAASLGEVDAMNKKTDQNTKMMKKS